jgi:hypothetical protein
MSHTHVTLRFGLILAVADVVSDHGSFMAYAPAVLTFLVSLTVAPVIGLVAGNVAGKLPRPRSQTRGRYLRGCLISRGHKVRGGLGEGTVGGVGVRVAAGRVRAVRTRVRRAASVKGFSRMS